jgi:ABC-type lipoprotein release transport system permease subunit
MELGWRWYPAAFAAALFGMALLAAAAGLAASWRALARRPVEVLRRV